MPERIEITDENGNLCRHRLNQCLATLNNFTAWGDESFDLFLEIYLEIDREILANLRKFTGLNNQVEIVEA